MARIALILRYQWRAFWRRLIRTRQRAQFYLTMFAVLGWLFGVFLPPQLSRAAEQLAAGETTSMDAVLWTLCVLWLFVVAEDTSISLSSAHLRTFPIGAGSLLAVRMLSLFCSPVAIVIALGSVISLWPLASARHPLLGGAAAMLLLAMVLGLATSGSHVLGVAQSRRKLLVPAGVIIIAAGAYFFARGLPGLEQTNAAVAYTPPHLVTAVAVGVTTSAALMPFMTLIGIGAAVGYLLFWSFRRSLIGQPANRAAGRAAGSALWFPGRFGGLVRKEQYYFRKLPDAWLGLLLVLAISVASLFGPIPPIVRQSIILVVFGLNVNLLMNCFGTDTAAEWNRYFILPLRGRDVLLVKNLGLAVIVTGQLSLLILTAAWQSGPIEAGAEVIEAAILLLSHLAWGNIVSVSAPFRMPFYRFATSGAPLTMMAGTTIGSGPALMMLFLLHSESRFAAIGTAAVLLMAIAAYLASLRYAGVTVEHRGQLIADRLSS